MFRLPPKIAFNQTESAPRKVNNTSNEREREQTGKQGEEVIVFEKERRTYMQTYKHTHTNTHARARTHMHTRIHIDVRKCATKTYVSVSVQC